MNIEKSDLYDKEIFYMSLDIDQIAEAFCSHQFVVTYPYMAEGIKWNIVGSEELIRRDAVIDRCDQVDKIS